MEVKRIKRVSVFEAEQTADYTLLFSIEFIFVHRYLLRPSLDFQFLFVYQINN